MPSTTAWRRDGEFAWFQPEAPEPAPGAVLWLHDVDGLPPRGDDPWSMALERHGLRAVAPLSRDAWWTDRLAEEDSGPTAEAEVVDRALPAIAERWGIRPPVVALAGAGAGGHGALRMAYKAPRWFPIAAAWAPAIDCGRLLDGRLRAPAGVTADAVRALATLYRDAEHARQDSAVLHIHPLNWPRHQRMACRADDAWRDGAERLRMKLTSLGVPHEAQLDARDEAAGVAWLVAGLAGDLVAVARAAPGPDAKPLSGRAPLGTAYQSTARRSP